MSTHHQPGGQRPVCRATGRRRPASQRASTIPGRPSRDVCPRRRRMLDPDHEAFVEWFVAYWRRRGAQLFASTTEGGTHE
jgi:hypothetical protein